MLCSAEGKATVNSVRVPHFSTTYKQRHLTTITRYITFKTGFHVRSRCLKVGRVPRGLFPGAWVGAADLLGLVSHTRTVLKIKGNIIFLFLLLAIQTDALSARLLFRGIKALANDDTLLRTHCCSWCFLDAQTRGKQNECCTSMLRKLGNIFLRTQNVSEQN